jgi:hypothetical protein
MTRARIRTKIREVGRRASIGSLLLAATCGVPRAHVDRDGVASTASTSWLDAASPAVAASPVDAAAAEPPAAEAIEMLRGIERLEDPNRMFLAVNQQPPRGFLPIPARRSGPFPGTPYASIRAYSYRFGARLALAADAGGPCDLVAPDGTLCPTVNAPGRRLSPAQQERLTALVRGAAFFTKSGEGLDLGRAYTRCDFEPHLAFVWFDSAQRPVGQLEIGFGCDEWDTLPLADGIRGPSVMRADEHDAVLGLCRDLGIDGCFLGDSSQREAFERAQYAPPGAGTPSPLVAWLARPPAVELDQALATTSISERRSLCAWHARRVAETLNSGVEPGIGWTCEDGYRGSLESLSECVDLFPECSLQVREILACVAQSTICSRQDPCGSHPECLWGVRVAAADAGIDR